VDAIAKVGLSEALESKLAELEARKRSLEAELRAAERTVILPDVSAIAAKYRAIVEDLENLLNRATPPEMETARKTFQSLFVIVHVDREGKGYADLAIGVPTNMVAGACCQLYLALVTALDILSRQPSSHTVRALSSVP
jgi:hypothetical protein